MKLKVPKCPHKIKKAKDGDYEKAQAALVLALNGPNRDAVIEVIGSLDGHGILSPEALIEKGFPREFVDPHTSHERSDGTPKGTIFNPQGEVVSCMDGVYELSFARAICVAVGADTGHGDSKMGRGFACRCYTEETLKKLGVNGG